MAKMIALVTPSLGKRLQAYADALQQMTPRQRGKELSFVERYGRRAVMEGENRGDQSRPEG